MPEVAAVVDAADDVREDRKRAERDRRQPGGQSVQAIGDVHGVARPGQDERDPEDV